MDRDELNERLGRITTCWALLDRFHDGPPDEASSALWQLLGRCREPAHRYLCNVLGGDAAKADSLAEEYAACLQRGDLRGATPARGRFRDYLRSLLLYLVRRRLASRQRGAAAPAPLTASDDDLNRSFAQVWSNHLLERAWAGLQQANAAWHEALRFRVAHPDLPPALAAQRLGRQGGGGAAATAPSAAEFRRDLLEARRHWVMLLFEEAAFWARAATPEAAVEELRDLQIALARPLG